MCICVKLLLGCSHGWTITLFLIVAVVALISSYSLKSIQGPCGCAYALLSIQDTAIDKQYEADREFWDTVCKEFSADSETVQSDQTDAFKNWLERVNNGVERDAAGKIITTCTLSEWWWLGIPLGIVLFFAVLAACLSCIGLFHDTQCGWHPASVCCTMLMLTLFGTAWMVLRIAGDASSLAARTLSGQVVSSFIYLVLTIGFCYYASANDEGYWKRKGIKETGGWPTPAGGNKSGKPPTTPSPKPSSKSTNSQAQAPNKDVVATPTIVAAI